MHNEPATEPPTTTPTWVWPAASTKGKLTKQHLLWIIGGLFLIAAMAVLFAPVKLDATSIDGYSRSVTLDCGSVLSPGDMPSGGGFGFINQHELCSTARQPYQLGGIALGLAGGVLLVLAFVVASQKQQPIRGGQ